MTKTKVITIYTTDEIKAEIGNYVLNIITRNIFYNFGFANLKHCVSCDFLFIGLLITRNIYQREICRL